MCLIGGGVSDPFPGWFGACHIDLLSAREAKGVSLIPWKGSLTGSAVLLSSKQRRVRGKSDDA